jgi:dTDP-4-dehydrorhamnose 3,5-epimerase
MHFHELPLAGAYLLVPDSNRDERGAFTRYFEAAAFREYGLCEGWVLNATALNTRKGTLRGLHYQLPPCAEIKIVRCTHGALWDVIVDLREGSTTQGRWHAQELSRHNGLALYVPEGFAHGYLTLAEDSEAEYLLSQPYAPDLARGLRWDDPALDIDWPSPPAVISDRDKTWPSLGQPGLSSGS